jgi:hypothetical protein
MSALLVRLLLAVAWVAGLAAALPGCKKPVRGVCTWTATDKTGASLEVCKETTAKECAVLSGDLPSPSFVAGAQCTALGYVCEPGDIGFPPPETVWRRHADGSCPAGGSPP